LVGHQEKELGGEEFQSRIVRVIVGFRILIFRREFIG
jgi:hypothetical protein